MVFDKEFKTELSKLSSSEKDKLILRLLKKDIKLANRLYFELVQDRGVDELRKELEIKIVSEIASWSKYHLSPGILMMYLRYMSGDINRHLSTTKDKNGEVSLTLTMLIKTLETHNELIIRAQPNKVQKFSLYVVARAFKLLVLISKLNEDLWIEFYPDLAKLGELMGKNNYLMETSIHHGLDVNWLLKGKIPEGIEQTQADLRKLGYLKN